MSGAPVGAVLLAAIPLGAAGRLEGETEGGDESQERDSDQEVHGMRGRVLP